MNKPNGVTLSEWIRGSGFCPWADEVAKLEAVSLAAQSVAEYFGADYSAPKEVEDLMEALKELEESND